MPRGRPKGSKNKSTLMKMELPDSVKEQYTSISDITKTPEEKPSILKPVKLSEYQSLPKYHYCCEVCGRSFPGSPNPIDFIRLTGKADYYRESRSRRLYVCNECALELSDVVDRWLLKKNPKLRKFPLNGGNNEEDVSDLS